ncbi:MAG: helix-turn-helix transcriptional regulator [Chitinophagales bacterium]|nr:helix-turn-helix transcriptional regulator [Chitinophagales bacterium]
MNGNNKTLDTGKLEKVSAVFRTIAHPTRLAVLELLDKNGQMSVNELMAITNCEQSLLSHHLANMRSTGLLKSERKGQNIFYSIKEEKITEVVRCIEQCKIN